MLYVMFKMKVVKISPGVDGVSIELLLKERRNPVVKLLVKLSTKFSMKLEHQSNERVISSPSSPKKKTLQNYAITDRLA